MNHNKKKSDQLGMSYGKANQILRKKILFHLICELDKNVCYRCNKVIFSIDDLSIEHKNDWLDSKDPKQLFFDLNNIVFSHLKCNNEARTKKYKITYPKDKKWCWSCKKFKKLNDFSEKAKVRRNRECIKCSSMNYKKYRKNKYSRPD